LVQDFIIPFKSLLSRNILTSNGLINRRRSGIGAERLCAGRKRQGGREECDCAGKPLHARPDVKMRSETAMVRLGHERIRFHPDAPPRAAGTLALYSQIEHRRLASRAGPE
jgi:hypothetical protein